MNEDISVQADRIANFFKEIIPLFKADAHRLKRHDMVSKITTTIKAKAAEQGLDPDKMVKIYIGIK